MTPVKIVACSDMHGIASFDHVANIAIRERAKIVVVAGDIQTAYFGRDPRMSFEDDFLRPTRRLERVGIEVVAVPGNHDFYLQQQLGRENVKRFTSNLHLLCDKRAKVLGVKFYGTPWVPTVNGMWCYEMDDIDLEDRFRKIPKGLDILVAHTPPFGLDSSELFDVSTKRPKRNWEHFGSKTLRKVIEVKKPRCVICGHIHTGDHAVNRVGDSAVVNVSLIGEDYHPAYEPTIIRISESNVEFRTEGSDEWTTI